jgi:hypothetical protein
MYILPGLMTTLIKPKKDIFLKYERISDAESSMRKVASSTVKYMREC